MRKVVMYCDRCKKEFNKWNHKRNELIGVAEIVYDSGDPYLDSQMDLCESCYDELEKWWNFDSQAGSDEVEIGIDVLTAMRKSAEAVKNSPKYDFSCVTSLFEEGDEK